MNSEIIVGAIAELEQKELTYPNLNKLATLYIVKDHLQLRPQEPLRASENVPRISDSNFIDVCSRADSERMWSILDTLMDSLKILYPKMYESVIRDIDASRYDKR